MQPEPRGADPQVVLAVLPQSALPHRPEPHPPVLQQYGQVERRVEVRTPAPSPAPAEAVPDLLQQLARQLDDGRGIDRVRPGRCAWRCPERPSDNAPTS